MNRDSDSNKNSDNVNNNSNYNNYNHYNHYNHYNNYNNDNNDNNYYKSKISMMSSSKQRLIRDPPMIIWKMPKSDPIRCQHLGSL